MLLLPRAAARSFGAVLRKALAGRPRGPSPAVRLSWQSGRLTLSARLHEFDLSLDVPDAGDCDGRLALTPADLEALAGPSGVAEVEPSDAARIVARWDDRGVPQRRQLVDISAKDDPPSPAQPTKWALQPPTFLAALHEAGRTTSRDPARFALHRLQVQGKAGRLVTSDGKQALMQAGFTFPFSDALLVPAFPVFGTKELQAHAEVKLGVEGDRLVVTAGPWAVGLLIDHAGKYPDVDGVVPRRGVGTELTLDAEDAARLADTLPRLPGAADDCSPVTLQFGDRVAVRAGPPGAVVELRLVRSKVTGPIIDLALDRTYLRRALALGFSKFRSLGPGKPLVAECGDRTYLAMTLDPSAVVTADPSVRVLDTAGMNGLPAPRPTLQPRPMPPEVTAMKPLPNGPTANGRHDPPPDAPDPLAEAEALRATLAEAAQQAAKLVQALRHYRKERRALSTAFSSLQSLRLGP